MVRPTSGLIIVIIIIFFKLLVCFDMVGSALSHFSCDESNEDVCLVPVIYAPVVAVR